MKFSIVIPIFNPLEKDIVRCILSIHKQNWHRDDYEIIIVDDGSTSDLIKPLKGFVRTIMSEQVIRLENNQGPGIARNVGIDEAKGDWIIFLDSDDELAPDALRKLSNFIFTNPKADAIGYNWAFSDNDEKKQRKDGKYLSLRKQDLLKEYLKLHMDGSVIYTAIKRSLILKNEITFRSGYHEDVDFIFNVYKNSSKIVYLDEILYLKTSRDNSIVNTITKKHLDGFVNAWLAIGKSINDDDDLIESYFEGMIGVVATRIREVHRLKTVGLLYDFLFTLPKKWKTIIHYSPLNTQYAQIAKEFISKCYVEESTFMKKWSCTDLQGSLFLAPNEVRTCCKRFFVDGEIRGDVKLVDAPNVSVDSILNAKQSLLESINKGEETACSGCPFMEFKAWAPIEPLKINYLSLEHHSICNMKCSYCSDDYYGGKKAEYDVTGLVEELEAIGSLEKCHTVVWGGGEPTVGKDFIKLVTFINSETNAQQRVLTNSLKYMPSIDVRVNEGQISIVTSIDAGTQETFTKVRGMGELDKVLHNLKLYSEKNPHLVTIKYILTEDNSDLDEICRYVDKIEEFELTACNFQISCDFKEEIATTEQVDSAIVMHHELHRIGCDVVFFDDLLYQRLVGADLSNVLSFMMESPNDYPEIVFFGSGAMSVWMLENSDFIKHVKIVAYNEYVPNIPVLITGSQSYPETYRKAIELGVPKELIINGVVL